MSQKGFGLRVRGGQVVTLSKSKKKGILDALLLKHGHLIL